MFDKKRRGIVSVCTRNDLCVAYVKIFDNERGIFMHSHDRRFEIFFRRCFFFALSA